MSIEEKAKALDMLVECLGADHVEISDKYPDTLWLHFRYDFIGLNTDGSILSNFRKLAMKMLEESNQRKEECYL